jgi:hypothetical protein
VVAGRDIERGLDVLERLVVVAAAARDHGLLQREEPVSGRFLDGLQQPGRALVPALRSRDLELVPVLRGQRHRGQRCLLHLALVAEAGIRSLRELDGSRQVPGPHRRM